MQFIDFVELNLKAGNGGDGIIAWFREGYDDKGGPAGGNGGSGGNIIIVGDHNIDTLFNFHNMKRIVAKDGEKGMNSNMYGKKAEDVIVKVPLGTIISEKKTGKQIIDIVNDNQTFVICNGGIGGRGNASFLSSSNKAPNLYERGDRGEERDVILELKVLANIGLVGKPNAGKSSLLAAISSAKPKIADYQFTTLFPILGVVNLSDKRAFVCADIPGLIENASSGAGLGFDFLKHIERCVCLLHLVSMDPIDNDDPYEAYMQINKELNNYNPMLLKKPTIIVATKMDVDGARQRLEKFISKVGKYVIDISVFTSTNIEQLKETAYYLYNKYNSKYGSKTADPIIINEDLKNEDGVTLFKLNKNEEVKRSKEQLVVKKISDNEWSVTSPRLEYWSYKIPQDTNDNILRFNQKMTTEGIFEELKKEGAQIKDIINVYGVQYVYDGH